MLIDFNERINRDINKFKKKKNYFLLSIYYIVKTSQQNTIICNKISFIPYFWHCNISYYKGNQMNAVSFHDFPKYDFQDRASFETHVLIVY